MTKDACAKQSNRESFVVRIWHDEDSSQWQGWVQHARTGEAVMVKQVDELLGFIERWTGRLDCKEDEGLK